MSFTAVLDTELAGASLVQAVHEALGSALLFEASTETEDTVVHRWRAADDAGSLEVVEDQALNIVHAVTSDAALRADMVAAFGSFSAAEVRDVIASDLPTEHVRLPMLALCNSQSFDPHSERLLVEASRHPLAEVRLSAVRVMATLGWPALRAQMFAMQSEADPRVVRVLQRAAAVWSARARAEKEGAPKHVAVKKSFRKEMGARRAGGGKGKAEAGARRDHRR